MKKTLLSASLISVLAFSSTLCFSANAADYVVDTKGAHASINFKIKHLGYSWLTGRFDKFSGNFSYDNANISASKINIDIDTTSVDSNHAERDKHLRSDDFLDVSKFSTAKFVSTSVEDLGNDKLKITGNLTLQGVSKTITIDAVKVGEGKDPWGGYRAGFSGTTSINMEDYGFKKNFGEVIFDLHLEGVRL